MHGTRTHLFHAGDGVRLDRRANGAIHFTFFVRTMRHAALRIMLPFLLLAQAVVGMSPGHAICIALDACCGTHVHAEPIGFEHDGCSDASACAPVHLHDHDGGHGHAHDHAHAAACPDDCAHACCAAHEQCDGDCSKGTSHFHLALPDDGGCTRDRSNDHFCDLRLLAPALLVFAVQPVVELQSQAMLPPPWAWPACDRTRALETDRLLI